MDFRTRPARILFGAHRGFRAMAPENTLPAFEQAASAGADFIELDVACTRDRRLVILHDDSLARTTNAGTAFRDGRLAACELRVVAPPPAAGLVPGKGSLRHARLGKA